MTGNQTSKGVLEWLGLRAYTEPQRVQSGRQGRLIVEVTMPPGAYIEAHDGEKPGRYVSAPAELELETPAEIHIGPIHYPKAEERRMEWTPDPLRVYQGAVRIEAPFEVAPDAAPGQYLIRSILHYQGCTTSVCLLPSTQAADTMLDVN